MVAGEEKNRKIKIKTKSGNVTSSKGDILIREK